MSNRWNILIWGIIGTLILAELFACTDLFYMSYMNVFNLLRCLLIRCIESILFFDVNIITFSLFFILLKNFIILKCVNMTNYLSDNIDGVDFLFCSMPNFAINMVTLLHIFRGILILLPAWKGHAPLFMFAGLSLAPCWPLTSDIRLSDWFRFLSSWWRGSCSCLHHVQ